MKKRRASALRFLPENGTGGVRRRGSLLLHGAWKTGILFRIYEYVYVHKGDFAMNNKKLSRLLEPNLQLYFLCMVLFCAATAMAMAR